MNKKNKLISKLFLTTAVASSAAISLLATSCGEEKLTWPKFTPRADLTINNGKVTGFNASFNSKILCIPIMYENLGLRVEGLWLNNDQKTSPKKAIIEEVWLPNKTVETDSFWLQDNLFEGMTNLKKVVYGSATQSKFSRQTWLKSEDSGTWTTQEFNEFSPKGFDIYYNWSITTQELKGDPGFYVYIYLNAWAPYGSKLNNIFLLKNSENVSPSTWVKLANGKYRSDEYYDYVNKGWDTKKIKYFSM